MQMQQMQNARRCDASIINRKRDRSMGVAGCVSTGMGSELFADRLLPVQRRLGPVTRALQVRLRQLRFRLPWPAGCQRALGKIESAFQAGGLAAAPPLPPRNIEALGVIGGPAAAVTAGRTIDVAGIVLRSGVGLQ